MRKVTREATQAFNAGRTGSFGSNTKVELSPLGHMLVLKLHNNAIARKDVETGKVEVCDGAGSLTQPRSASTVCRVSL